MAALIHHARAVREEAERARLASVELRMSVKRSNRIAHVRTEKAATATAAASERRRLVMVVPSPWSRLEWLRGDDELERTLVPLP